MSKKGAIDLSQGAKMLEGGREDFKDASVIPAAQGFTNLFHAVSNYDAGREAERLGARVRGAMREIQAASSEYYDKKNDLEDFRTRAGIESEISQFSSEIRNEIKASQGTNADGLHEKISKKWSEFSTRFDERLTQFNDPKVAEAVKLRISEAQIRDISDALGQQNEEGVKVAEPDSAPPWTGSSGAKKTLRSCSRKAAGPSSCRRRSLRPACPSRGPAPH
jgi:hypothetical protein